MRRLLVTQNNLINLSEEQLSIVTSTATNIIVNAGAGAGKTRVLVERVKHLLKQGVNPTSIVVITFTNMAADELKERLAHIKGSSNCFVGTIHSYANMLLKRSGYQFEIFSEQHQDQFMKNLIADYAYYINYDYYLVYKEFIHKLILVLFRKYLKLVTTSF
jgi:DNA helicase-2/ATP-dependent DNA helicase PcrA